MDDVAAGPIHGDSGREAALWSVYTAINRQFADTIVQCFNEGDLVWIHGFHLLILPSLLTRRIPMAKIGLFTHTPFPSSEIFRTLWCREELLRGMLNADQVGFHLFEYARHFLTCCRRLLGLTYGMIPDLNGSHSLAIENNGRQVVVTSIHAGVEPPILNQFLCQTSTVEKTYEIRKQFAGKVIFCAIDKLESLKGIPLKLLGIERFLQRCPQWVGKIVLIQVGISAFEMGDDYMKTKNQVTSMAANINMRWPGTVQFQECSESEMRLPQRMTLLRAADVLMVTPLRDALNRIPLEFTMAHLDVLTEEGRNDGRQRGICILSEFSSTSRVMRGALHVNPWRISHIASAFQQALTMTQEERIRRATCASEFVTHVTTQRWALAVLLNLKAVQKDSNVGRSGVGLGLGYRILGMDSGYDTLDMNKVARSYKDSRSRLIILDYGGTILPNDNTDCFTRYQFVHKLRTPTVPDNRLLSILKELCSDNRNHVFVVSGKERHSLTSTLGDIPNLGLVSEHGMFVSWPAKKAGKRIWETTVPEQDKSWRSLAIMIMEVYSSRTHGSYIEETEMKVLWQYRDADPEFGYQQSRELEDHLSNVLREYAVDVLHGGVKEGGYVEVRPKGVNKGFASMHIIKNMAISNKIDFSLVIGDDHCDEPMLSVMRQIGRRAMEAKSFNDRTVLTPLPASVTPVDVSSTDPFVSSRLQTYTATVGKKPSASANYLNDVDDVHELLECLNRMSARDHQFYSSIDLTSMTYPIAGSGLSGVKKTGSVQFLSGSNSETITANVTRQVSLVSGFLSSEGVNPAKVEKQTSNTLADYLNTVEDDDDDDMFF
uniref:Trehalose-phosphatase n=1 Tax=Proboscia inermis TaxID=420281 RepID=A0A7S0CN27_9STRA